MRKWCWSNWQRALVPTTRCQFDHADLFPTARGRQTTIRRGPSRRETVSDAETAMPRPLWGRACAKSHITGAGKAGDSETLNPNLGLGKTLNPYLSFRLVLQ